MTSGLPSGWAVALLGEVTEGVSKIDPGQLGRRTFRYIDIGSIEGGAYRVGKVDPIPVDEAPQRARQRVKAGDTVFSTVRPYLRKIAYIDEALDGEIASTGFCVLRPSAALDARYLFYLTQWDRFINEVCAEQRGVSYPAVREEDLRRISVPIPPLAEQRRIVAALDDHLGRLDIASAGLSAIERRAKVLSDSLAARAVSGRLIDGGQDFESGEDLHQQVLAERAAVVSRRRIKPVALGAEFPADFPKRWALVAVDELAAAIEYGTSAKTGEIQKQTDVPVLRMGNLQAGVIDASKLKYLPKDHVDVQRLILSDGDLLFNRTNSAELVGKSAVYRSHLGRMTFASYLIRCQFLSGIESEWVNVVINSPYGRKYIASVASQQVGQANVNGSKLAAMPIPLPSTAEQRAILSELSIHQERLARVRQLAGDAARRSAALRRSVLKSAFTGKLVPQDPSDEPIHELLEQLKADSLMGRKAKRPRRSKPQPKNATADYVEEELPL